MVQSSLTDLEPHHCWHGALVTTRNVLVLFTRILYIVKIINKIQCEYPVAPDHGRVFVVGDKPIVGSLVVYACNENRRLVGSATARCSDTGKWLNPKPRCIELFGVGATSPSVGSSISTPVRTTPIPTPIQSSMSTPVQSSISTPVQSSISNPEGSSISSSSISTGIQSSSVEYSQPSLVPLVSNSSCTCTYINSDANLVGYANTQRLQNRDLVKDGYKVQFHCSPLGYYRLRGPRSIICRYCRTWFSSEYPKCVLPRMGDVIIRTQGTESFTEFPGGYLGVPQGSLLRLICLQYHKLSEEQSGEDSLRYPPTPELFRPQYRPGMDLPSYQPEWKVLFSDSNDILAYNQVIYEHGTIIKTQVLELSNIKREHNNVYYCEVRSGRNISIEIQAVTPDATCPKFNQERDFTVQYSKEQSVNSSAVFSCKNSNERIVGFPNLTCMSNGHWSADPPQCMKICPKLQEAEGMRIHYSNLQETDSTANFHCQAPRMLNGVSYTRCKSDGHWADPLPTCEMSLCHLSDLYDGFPGNVVLMTVDTLSDTVPYNFSLRLDCASNGRTSGMPDIVKCGLGGMWEIGDTKRHEGQILYTGPARPSRYGPPQSPDRSLRQSSYGGPPETPSIRMWFDKCFRNIGPIGNIGPGVSRGSYPMYFHPRSTTKRPRS